MDRLKPGHTNFLIQLTDLPLDDGGKISLIPCDLVVEVRMFLQQ